MKDDTTTGNDGEPSITEDAWLKIRGHWIDRLPSLARLLEKSYPYIDVKPIMLAYEALKNKKDEHQNY